MGAPYFLFNLFILVCGAIVLVAIKQAGNDYLGGLISFRQLFLRLPKSCKQISPTLRHPPVSSPSSSIPYRAHISFLRFVAALSPWLLIPVHSQRRALAIFFIFQGEYLVKILDYVKKSREISFVWLKHQTLTHLISQCLYVPLLLTVVSLSTTSNFVLRTLAAAVAMGATIIHNGIGLFRGPTTPAELDAGKIWQISGMLNVMFSIAFFISVTGANVSIFGSNVPQYSLFLAKIAAITVSLFLLFANIPSLSMDQCRYLFTRVIAPVVVFFLLLVMFECASYQAPT